MKPTDWDPNFWTVRPDEKPVTLADLGLLLAIAVLALLVFVTGYVVLWAQYQ